MRCKTFLDLNANEWFRRKNISNFIVTVDMDFCGEAWKSVGAFYAQELKFEYIKKK